MEGERSGEDSRKRRQSHPTALGMCACVCVHVHLPWEGTCEDNLPRTKTPSWGHSHFLMRLADPPKLWAAEDVSQLLLELRDPSVGQCWQVWTKLTLQEETMQSSNALFHRLITCTQTIWVQKCLRCKKQWQIPYFRLHAQNRKRLRKGYENQPLSHQKERRCQFCPCGHTIHAYICMCMCVCVCVCMWLHPHLMDWMVAVSSGRPA